MNKKATVLGKHLDFTYKNYKIDIYQPDYRVGILSIQIKGKFKASEYINYSKLSKCTRKKIKSLISPVFNKNIVIVGIPLKIIENKTQNLCIDMTVKYPVKVLKTDYLFQNEIKKIISIIIDNFLIMF